MFIITTLVTKPLECGASEPAETDVTSRSASGQTFHDHEGFTTENDIKVFAIMEMSRKSTASRAAANSLPHLLLLRIPGTAEPGRMICGTGPNRPRLLSGPGFGGAGEGGDREGAEGGQVVAALLDQDGG